MVIVLTIIMCKKTSDAQCNCSPPADRCPAYPRAAGPPTPASHPYILFSMTSDGMEYPFGQFGSAVLGLSPPSSCCTPSLLAGRTEREAEKSLAWCKHCSATIKTSACYQRSSHPNPKHSTLPATMSYLTLS